MHPGCHAGKARLEDGGKCEGSGREQAARGSAEEQAGRLRRREWSHKILTEKRISTACTGTQIRRLNAQVFSSRSVKTLCELPFLDFPVRIPGIRRWQNRGDCAVQGGGGLGRVGGGAG